MEGNPTPSIVPGSASATTAALPSSGNHPVSQYCEAAQLTAENNKVKSLLKGIIQKFGAILKNIPDMIRNFFNTVVRLYKTPDDVDVNATDEHGNTLLMRYINAGQGYENQIQYLLSKKGIDVNKQNNDGITPLILAVGKRLPEYVKLLLNCDGIDAGIQGENANTALISAVSGCLQDDEPKQLECLKLLINSGINLNINATNINGDSVLTACIYKSSPEYEELLEFVMKRENNLN
ncbi:MAG: ankyrin repeat domain-containing protein [Endozoicomonadaceae bacterium]|nr:ankyrin repeat domain-containing protein [Endozoicomonadaceae bacterium]